GDLRSAALHLRIERRLAMDELRCEAELAGEERARGRDVGDEELRDGRDQGGLQSTARHDRTSFVGSPSRARPATACQSASSAGPGVDSDDMPAMAEIGWCDQSPATTAGCRRATPSGSFVPGSGLIVFSALAKQLAVLPAVAATPVIDHAGARSSGVDGLRDRPKTTPIIPSSKSAGASEATMI